MNPLEHQPSLQDRSPNREVSQADADARSLLVDMDRIYGPDQTKLFLARIFNDTPMLGDAQGSFFTNPIPEEFRDSIKAMSTKYSEQAALDALRDLRAEREAKGALPQ